MNYKSEMDFRIAEILTEIENNFSRPLTNKSLAKSINLCNSRLEHLFKQEVGISLNKYIKNLRLEKTRELLETTFLSGKEICVKVGLSNQGHFIEDFKKKYGKTPSDYRKEFYKSKTRG
jgi:two-component system, response regulator YesN